MGLWEFSETPVWKIATGGYVYPGFHPELVQTNFLSMSQDLWKVGGTELKTRRVWGLVRAQLFLLKESLRHLEEKLLRQAWRCRLGREKELEFQVHLDYPVPKQQ